MAQDVGRQSQIIFALTMVTSAIQFLPGGELGTPGQLLVDGVIKPDVAVHIAVIEGQHFTFLLSADGKTLSLLRGVHCKKEIEALTGLMGTFEIFRNKIIAYRRVNQ